MTARALSAVRDLADVYLGPGGRTVKPRSEGMVLSNAVAQLKGSMTRGGASQAKIVAKVIAELEDLQEQVENGYHKNPFLIIHNPPKGLTGKIRVLGPMSEEVHEIRYRHVDDGEPYKHPFNKGVRMLAVEREGRKELFMTHERGLPLWEDFN